MIEFKRIDEKEIWVVVKTYLGGKQEFIGAYWDKDKAKRVAAENLPSEPNAMLSLTAVMLHGSMIDKK